MHTTRNGSQTGPRETLEYPIGDLLRGERATLGRSLLDVQRDLRIKAAHIAAIEDADLSVFTNRGVIPGYVRSYARYLDLEPEQVYRVFCEQTGFSSATFGATSHSDPRAGRTRRAAPVQGSFHPDFPLATRRGGFALPAVPLSAIGSLLVLVALVGGLGYGGWTVVRNIQRVQFVPVEEIPVAVAEVDDLAQPEAPRAPEPEFGDLASPVTATALSDLYRDQEAAVPILTPRDGPIAAINPGSRGPLPDRATPPAPQQVAAAPATGSVPAPASATVQGAVNLAVATTAAEVAGPAPVDPAVPVAAPAPAGKLTVVAERAAWIRVYLGDGTIVFERILEKGESYSPPEGLADPKIWAGNSGSVYVRVGDTLRGPLGSGTRAARDVPLAAASLAEKYPPVEQVPEVVSQSLGTDIPASVPAVAIQ